MNKIWSIYMILEYLSREIKTQAKAEASECQCLRSHFYSSQNKKSVSLSTAAGWIKTCDPHTQLSWAWRRGRLCQKWAFTALEIIILSNISQTHKDEYLYNSCYMNLLKFIKVEIRLLGNRKLNSGQERWMRLCYMIVSK